MREPGTWSQRGAAAATVVLLLAALMATLALAINVGRFMSVRGELQNAADAAAVSGAGFLDGKSENVVPARDAAVDYGRRNDTDSQVQVDVRLADVELGNWGSVTGTGPKVFTPLDPAAAPPDQINAVRVTTQRNAQRGGGSVNVFFSAFLGNKQQSDVAAQAIAVRGGPCHLGCFQMPLAVSNCEFPFTCDVPVTATWSSDKTDEFAWTEGIIGNVNTSDLVAILQSIGPDETCNRPLDAGSLITVNNGVKNNACNELETVWLKYPGRKYFIPKITVDSCPAPGTKFVGDYPVYEFVAIEILEVKCNPTKYVKLVMRCSVPAPEGASGTGCGFTSISPQPPGLAQ